jgi:Xaa-Pro aminopeptidase
MMKNRILILQEWLKNNNIKAALLAYSRDILYYTGIAQPSYLVVLQDDFFLFIRRGYNFALNDVSIDKKKIKNEGDLLIIYNNMFNNVKNGEKIATELDILPYNQVISIKSIFKGYAFVNVTPAILKQRMVKDDLEVSKIKEACRVIDLGHQAIINNLREGITELELSALIENAHRLGGHEGIFFIRKPDFYMSRGPISSGRNLFLFSGVVYSVTGVGLSPSVPAGPSRKIILKNDIIIVDIPTLVDGYHADQSRTYFLGNINKSLKDEYLRLKDISDFLIYEIKPGMRCCDIYKLALERSKKLNISDAFLYLPNGTQSKFIGHGIGLEINEPPFISSWEKSELSENSVIALEIHLMNKSLGVFKLEDTIRIGSDGNEILTVSPRKLIEVS